MGTEGPFKDTGVTQKYDVTVVDDDVQMVGVRSKETPSSVFVMYVQYCLILLHKSRSTKV